MQETLACVEVGGALGYVGAVDGHLLDKMRRILGTLVRLSGK